MYIEFNPIINLNKSNKIKGIEYNFMISPGGLPYIKYKNVQLLLMHTGYFNYNNKLDYAHISFNTSEIQSGYATPVYFLFKLGTEPQIPKHITSKLSKNEKEFLSKIREFVKNYK